MLKSFSKRLARWIPNHISAKFVVAVYRILDVLCIGRGSVRKKHETYNCQVLNSEVSPLKAGYVENQAKWSDVKYGKTDMAFAGCEVLAVYNALLAIGMTGGAGKMAELIRHFEGHGAALHGIIGTSPWAMYKYLKKQGVQAKVVWKEEELNNTAKATIVTMYNNCFDLYDQIHTVSYNHEAEGVVSHNASSDGKFFEDIYEAVRGAGENAKMICAIEIQ